MKFTISYVQTFCVKIESMIGDHLFMITSLTTNGKTKDNQKESNKIKRGQSLLFFLKNFDKNDRNGSFSVLKTKKGRLTCI